MTNILIKCHLLAEDYFINICKISLRIIGIWPELHQSEGPLTKYRAIGIFLFILLFINISQTIKLFMIWGEIDVMSEVLCKIDLPVAVVLLMIAVFWNSKADMRPLVALINEDWRIPKTEEDKIVMLNMAQTARTISLICLFLSQGTFLFHTAGEVYYMIDLSNDFFNQTRRLFILSHFPYNTRNSPIFELTWFSQCFATFLATITYAGVHGFFAVLVLHLCAQFAILRSHLVNVINQIVAKTCQKEFRKEYSTMVKRHQHLNRCVDIIEDSFNTLFLAEMLACSIQFCLQGYQLSLMTRNDEKPLPLVPLVVMVIFLMYMMVLFYIYCYVAEELRYQSTEVVYAAYSCEWYELTSKEANNLLLLMQRGKKPGTLTAGKFCTLSLQLFNNILKTSAGYLSVLLTMTNKKEILNIGDNY